MKKDNNNKEKTITKVPTRTPRYWDRVMAAAALLLIAVAWLTGALLREESFTPHIKQVVPETDTIEAGTGGTYKAWKDAGRETLLGYIGIGRAHGYAGELIVAAAVDSAGKVIHTRIVSHKETLAFFDRVKRGALPEWLIGKSYTDNFHPDNTLDGVSGATLSSRAIADATRRAARNAAVAHLDATPLPEPSPAVVFGWPEIILIALFLIGITARLSKFKYVNVARWVSMGTGLLFLGFVFNRPLTIVMVNKMLLGFWPQWQTNLYWYLLMGGVLLVYAVDNKNAYCQWFCPFGGAQECLALVGGGKVKVPEKYRVPLRWLPRILALSAVLLALVLRNPGFSSYEVFGVVFHLVGSAFLFGLTAVVLIVSLFIKRPWCTYLCPLKPVTDFIQLSRTWTKEKIATLRAG